MYKNIKVEAENLELILENSHGDKAIIPANKRDWVKQKLSEGCHSCIDDLVETLPIASQYAQDGSVYPPNTKVKVNHNNQIKEYDINSSEYRDLYNSGKLTNYDKNTDTYIATPLKEVTVTTEAPQWLKYKREYEKNNPKKDYINKYLTTFAKSLGNTETNYPKRLDAEYEQKSLDYIGEQLIKNKPQGKLSRVEWLNQMSDKEEEIIKRNPKYQSSLWADTKRGLTSLVEQNPLQTFQNILNSSDYTNREKQEMLKDYSNHPLMSKLGDAAKILNPLTVPTKMVQSAYKDDYSFADALKGKQNNAGIVEDIVTDPLNLVGVGLAGKLSKADKVIDATKVGGKVLSKADDAVNNINRIKFDDFKNDNEFFRVIVGDEAFDDIVQTQKIRTKQPSSVENTPPNTINLDRRGSTAFPSFSKGSPSLRYANDNPNHYIIRTADESIKPSTSGRHGKGTTMFPTDKSGKHLTELDASKVQVYKHVGNGEYELVNTAKPIISSVDDVGKQASKQWQLEELPGLHLKSTMEGQSISKIIEPKANKN